VFKRKTDLSSHRSTVKALQLTNALLIFGVIGFGISQSFAIAVLLYCLTEAVREVREPIQSAWANQSIASNVRATVLSMCSQADAIGQFVGGPVLGVIAVAVSVKASIIGAGLILVPTLFFYMFTLKDHDKTVSQAF
jgi:DHA3 family tetracycline resistance protein-like MFS transporter